MKETTLITLAGLACLTIFSTVAVLMGYDNFLALIVIAVIAASMGIMIPTPHVFKKEKG